MAARIVTPAPADGVRRVAPVVGRESWARCEHDGTAVDPVGGEVLLTPVPADPRTEWPRAAPPHPVAERAGLAFDGNGCLLRGDPARGQVQRAPWPRRGEVVDLLAGPAPAAAAEPGGFVAVGGDPRRPLRAWALTADRDEHLVVLDGAAGRVVVLDLADGHLMRTVAIPGTAVDLAADRAGAVLVATASRTVPLLRLEALGRPVPLPAPAALAGVPPGARPSRVAVGPDGSVWLLLRAGVDAWVIRAGPRPPAPLRVPGGVDLAVDGAGRIVVAGPAGGGLRTWTVAGDRLEGGAPLVGRDYDGRGIVTTPDGPVGFWSGSAFRVAVAARTRFGDAGAVETHQLDSHRLRCRWGRLFVEACVPPGTSLLVGVATADELPGEPDVLADPAPDAVAALRRVQPLHRRETGREGPWSPLPPGDRFAVYEAPVTAPPGRYLWVRLQLAGPGTTTPRIRALRAEFPGHDLLEKLPRAYGRDPAAASFLRRMLAVVDGQLGDIEARAVHRDLLLDPRGAPPQLLGWIGSLIGLTLDARWPDHAQRTLLAEAGSLFHRRGTPAGLRRLLEIYLGAPVVILEAFRLRAPASAIGGAGPAPAAVVGGGLRIGATPPGGAPAGDPFREHAHRFTVLITRELDGDQRAVVADLLDLHRPAHTLVEVCTVGRGMRVGMSLHVGMSTIVGPGSGFRPLRVGDPAGRDRVLGRGRAGIRTGSTVLDGTTVIDP